MQERRINAVAPTRICDIGGWTDTWFAGHGAIFNIAVYPYVEVQLTLRPRRDEARRVRIGVENFRETYSIDPDDITYGKHPLIEAAIDAMGVPADVAMDVNIYSDAPPGASMGTSAAVSVALVGALSRLTPGQLTAHETAAVAHALETEKLGLQCGIQDQIASAYGGLNFIEMHAFPRAAVSPVQISNRLWWELENRLAVVYIGRPHSSSDTHRMVIRKLGEDASRDERICALRELARTAKNALCDGDFDAFGRAMSANTEQQRRLHPQLVCEAFEDIITVARDFHAVGTKVNGAGGDGGSITILTSGDMAEKRNMLRAMTAHGYTALPIYLSRQGLRVWEPGPPRAGA